MNQLTEYNNSLKEGEKRLENNEFFPRSLWSYGK